MFDFLANYDEYPHDLSLRDVSKILKVSVEAVRRYVRLQQLEAYRIGTAYVVSKEALRRFILDRRTM